MDKVTGELCNIFLCDAPLQIMFSAKMSDKPRVCGNGQALFDWGSEVYTTTVVYNTRLDPAVLYASYKTHKKLFSFTTINSISFTVETRVGTRQRGTIRALFH